MLLLNKIRYIAWRCLDGFNKDSIYKRLKNIDRAMSDDDYYEEYLKIKLNELIEYSRENVEFYSKYKYESFSEMPVINKKIILDEMDKFKSEEYKNQDNHVMSTSGSTGIPFKIEQDAGKRKQVLAEIIYFSEMVGYKIGKKLVYLRNLESGFKKSKFKKFIQNEEIISTQKYDDITIGDIVNRLIRMESNTTVLGYASTLQMISSYMHRNKIKASNVSGIISGAESITSKTRKLVKEQFRCPVVSRYSNQEMGILAQDYEENEFILNRASYYFEVLDVNKDIPTKYGEVGRIVVTDLYNYAMPLIRYDTGDLGILDIDSKGRTILSAVYGRKIDLLYTTKNEPLSFFAFDDLFETNMDIEQYQIIQDDRTNITVNLIMKSGKTIDTGKCIEDIKKIMGDDCDVTIKFLDTMPITNSGKFRYVICNYKPELN